MRRHCANRDCGATLTPANRSSDDSTYCSTCGDLVYAFRPDQSVPDDWYLVSDGHKPIEGDYAEGGQCELCALSRYRIVQRGSQSWAARCTGQWWDGDWHKGCGMEHPVRMKMRFLVIGD